MIKITKDKTKRYIILVLVLVCAPLLRELLFGVFSEHHSPFATQSDAIHTFSEMFVMLVVGGFLVVLDLRLTKDKDKELRVTQAVAIEALASLAEYRDTETSQHLQRISQFVIILCRRLKDDSPYAEYLKNKTTYIEDLANASILHDIGKIPIPDGILLKPGSLTVDEFEEIKAHTVIGSEILLAADAQLQKRLGEKNYRSYLMLAQSIARGHHERWDGTGYPDGLKGEDIPLAARIVAVCDVYDAVTTKRVYKDAWTHDKAVKLIRDGRGTHFDPVITDIFLEEEQLFRETKRACSKVFVS